MLLRHVCGIVRQRADMHRRDLRKAAQDVVRTDLVAAIGRERDPVGEEQDFAHPNPRAIIGPMRLASGSGSRRRYSYTDLLELRVIKSLLDAGIKLENVRDIFSYLRDHLNGDVTSANLVIQGSTAVLIESDGELITNALASPVDEPRTVSLEVTLRRVMSGNLPMRLHLHLHPLRHQHHHRRHPTSS